MSCGVDKQVCATLNEKRKLLTDDNLAVLLFDEMSIRKNLHYSPKADMIYYGYQDHGGQGRSPQVASYALVFMVVGIRKRFKQPIAHYFSGESVTADRLSVLVKEDNF